MMLDANRQEKVIALHNGFMKVFSKVAVAKSRNIGLKLTERETKDFFEIMYPIMKRIQDEIEIDDLEEAH